jgi:hypothetical protein
LVRRSCSSPRQHTRCAARHRLCAAERALRTRRVACAVIDALPSSARCLRAVGRVSSDSPRSSDLSHVRAPALYLVYRARRSLGLGCRSAAIGGPTSAWRAGWADRDEGLGGLAVRYETHHTREKRPRTVNTRTHTIYSAVPQSLTSYRIIVFVWIMHIDTVSRTEIFSLLSFGFYFRLPCYGVRYGTCS